MMFPPTTPSSPIENQENSSALFSHFFVARRTFLVNEVAYQSALLQCWHVGFRLVMAGWLVGFEGGTLDKHEISLENVVVCWIYKFDGAWLHHFDIILVRVLLVGKESIESIESMAHDFCHYHQCDHFPFLLLLYLSLFLPSSAGNKASCRQ